MAAGRPIRVWCGRGLLLVALLIASVWIVSMWRGATMTRRTTSGTGTTALFAGTMCVITGEGGQPAFVKDTWSLHGPKCFWWFQFAVTPQQTNVVVPLWAPLLLVSGGCWALWGSQHGRKGSCG